jgi:hypothetical protein
MVPNLPPHLQPAAQIALDSGMPHIAAKITEGALRGDSAQTIAQNIAPHLAVSATATQQPAPSIGDTLAQAFGG